MNSKNTAGTLERARFLIEHKRFQQAEKEIGGILSNDPEDFEALSLLALSKINSNHEKDAIALIAELIAKHPDNDHIFYLHAFALLNIGKHKEAEISIRKAIQLNPNNAHYFEVLARVFIQREKWNKALQYVNDGLAIDPVQVDCLNIKTIVLTKLKNIAGADETIHEALKQAPEYAYTHNSVGWSKFEQGQYDEASIYFREALRLFPSFKQARQGLLETLKAKNPVYRSILKFSTSTIESKKTPVWGRIFSIIITINLMILKIDFMRDLEIHTKFFWPIVVACLLFQLFINSTYFFNIVISLHRENKHILTRNETILSYTCCSITVLTVGLIIGWAISNQTLFLVSALISFILNLWCIYKFRQAYND